MKETFKTLSNSWVNSVKSLSIYDMLLFGAILLFFVITSIDYRANSIQSANSETLQGHFESLQKNKIYKDIGHSYKLKLLDTSLEYIIKADYANCLNLEQFNSNVKRGDFISITTESNNRALILSIKKGTTILMDIGCVNTTADRIGVYIPMFIVFSVVLLWWLQRKIKRDRVQP